LPARGNLALLELLSVVLDEVLEASSAMCGHIRLLLLLLLLLMMVLLLVELLRLLQRRRLLLLLLHVWVVHGNEGVMHTVEEAVLNRRA